MKISPYDCYQKQKDKIVQKLSYSDTNNFDCWKKELKNKFEELTGINLIKKNNCPFNEKILSQEIFDGYKRVRFVFESEVGALVPVCFLIPTIDKPKFPVLICLQGHSLNYNNSLGIAKSESEFEYIEQNDGDIALQAVKQGYVAIAIEQRAMGENRSTKFNRNGADCCEYDANVAFMLGRTLIGERIYDVSRLLDLLVEFNKCDLDKIMITGNLGGGTTAYYAACYDERIKIVIPVCAFSNYKYSITNYYHCACNYIPYAYNWFEMADLAGLIFPRKIICIAGKDDEIYPISGVRKSFHTIEKIYNRFGLPDNCRLAVSNKGHAWCKNIIWPALESEMIKLGWKE